MGPMLLLHFEIFYVRLVNIPKQKNVNSKFSPENLGKSRGHKTIQGSPRVGHF